MTTKCVLLAAFKIKMEVVVSPVKYTDIELGALLLISIGLLVLILIWILQSYKRLNQDSQQQQSLPEQWLDAHISNFGYEQLEKLIRLGESDKNENAAGTSPGAGTLAVVTISFILLSSLSLQAQSTIVEKSVFSSPGVLIIVGLLLIVAVTVFFVAVKLNRISRKVRRQRAAIGAEHIAAYLRQHNSQPILDKLLQRKKALGFKLSNSELGSRILPQDKKGVLLNISEVDTAIFIEPKKKAAKRHDIDPRLVNLILWYLGSAAFWLVLGTSVGEYLGIKFVAPDTDHVSWLSFGRLRPVHTNMVFWGWSSLAMIGLGYYVVSTVSNSPVLSIKRGYLTLILMNIVVIAGSILLMVGVNNGGGEYREYIWPVMTVFAVGIVLTLTNYMQIIANRKTNEIYISNWYIIAAMMFILVIVTVAYVPFWQNGLGETIIQGFYMHQAVGMWFMMFNLGLIYYFLPQQLNTPIYSYSLGIIAFWSQILFYTVIGTHHFLFSAIPWWLQTVAIVGSVGMLIPVFSGTTNFLMTFRGNFQRIGNSYTLPFYLVGIIFYFTGSVQGTAEAFRATNLAWHFTDFTVAHSHMTMYGIISFFLWACIYTLIPRLTGKEPKQSLVGAHFWLALIGLLFYAISLMIGGTLKGISWISNEPFIEGVKLMAPFWLWRAIGGSLMWLSHLVFAWNMYTMIAGRKETDINKIIMEELDRLPLTIIIQ